jgi:hypothetical protein
MPARVSRSGSDVREGEPSSEADPARGGVQPSSEADPARGALSPRARRTLLEGAFSPQARRTMLEGAFRCAALVGRGGHQDRDRVVHAF